MTTGIGFIDILVSEITMVIGALIFLVCGALLIFKKKALSGTQIGLVITALIITGIYLVFILWLVIGFGQAGPR